MATFFTILILIASVLLILIVLIQNPKGGGIASNFISTNQFIGVRQQAELIERITWGFAIGIVALSLGVSAFSGGGSSQQESKQSIVSEADVPNPATGAPVLPNLSFPEQQNIAPLDTNR